MFRNFRFSTSEIRGQVGQVGRMEWVRQVGRVGRAGQVGQTSQVAQAGLVARIVSALGLSLVLLAFAPAFAALDVGAAPAWQAAAGREIAITFDDLPIAGVLPRDIETSRELTGKLLAGVAAHHVPAIGFVNEDKLNAADGTVDPQRVDLLRRWLDGGLELGNHAYSHPDLHLMPLDAFEADVLKGERVTRPLMAARGLTLRFFRHPFLHTGRTSRRRRRSSGSLPSTAIEWRR